jgi:hypothetical protein
MNCCFPRYPVLLIQSDLGQAASMINLNRKITRLFLACDPVEDDQVICLHFILGFLPSVQFFPPPYLHRCDKLLLVVALCVCGLTSCFQSLEATTSTCHHWW